MAKNIAESARMEDGTVLHIGDTVRLLPMAYSSNNPIRNRFGDIITIEGFDDSHTILVSAPERRTYDDGKPFWYWPISRVELVASSELLETISAADFESVLN